MARVLSIDLACKQARNFGFCVIEKPNNRISFPSVEEIGLLDPPDPRQYAERIQDYCRDQDIHLVMMDGPQGWKDPQRADEQYRVCERLTRAQAKTCLRGEVKPRNFKAFVEFSIETFSCLRRLGAVLLDSERAKVPEDGILVLESMPLSAWRRLFILPLPARRNARDKDIEGRLLLLEKLFGFQCNRVPNHDELQALVSGLAGVAILAGNAKGYIAEGVPPKVCDGVVVEGFIVNPLADRTGTDLRSRGLEED